MSDVYSIHPESENQCVLMKKIVSSIKNKPENIIIILTVIFAYYINNTILKSHTQGKLHIFFVCYFNDLICPLFLMAYINLLLLTTQKELTHIYHIHTICLSSGFFWEFVAPLIKKSSVCDIFDLLCYYIGGTIYWFILQSLSYCRKKYISKSQ